MKRIFTVLTFVALAACSPSSCSQQKTDVSQTEAATQVFKPVQTDLPAGDYTLDKSHASIVFKVSHMGFSNYTASFTSFDAQLKLDPKDPTKAELTATIDPKSLTLNNPPAGFLDALLGKDWLDTAQYPDITFRSTKIELTGSNTARITGDFTLHGVKLPLTLNAQFNGGYPGFAMDPHARVGFSAHGTIKRSDYGISYGIPAPGSNMGVSDEVDVQIEVEFSGPEWKGEAQPQPQAQ